MMLEFQIVKLSPLLVETYPPHYEWNRSSPFSFADEKDPTRETSAPKTQFVRICIKPPYSRPPPLTH